MSATTVARRAPVQKRNVASGVILLLIGFAIFFPVRTRRRGGHDHEVRPERGNRVRARSASPTWSFPSVAVHLRARRDRRLPWRGAICPRLQASRPGHCDRGRLLRAGLPDLGRAGQVVQPDRHAEQRPGARHADRAGGAVRGDQRTNRRRQHRHRRHDAHVGTDRGRVGVLDATTSGSACWLPS